MAKFKNYYEVLEIASFSEGDAVKSAFRKLARKYHPDLNPNDPSAEEHFKAINEAYDILSDEQRKKSFDHSLMLMQGRWESRGQSNANTAANTATKTPKGDSKSTHTKNNASTASGKNGAQAGAPQTKTSSNTSGNGTEQGNPGINEFFESFLNWGQTVTGGEKPSAKAGQGGQNKSQKKTPGFGQGETFKPQGKRGEDVTVPVSINSEEAQEGVIKTVNVQHNDICRRCAGTGMVNGVMCLTCQGKKVLTRLKKIDVRIPAGVKQGSKVRVAREGGNGADGGEPGDLFLVVELEEQKRFRVEGADVYSELQLPVTLAALGGEVQVLTMHGEVKMTLPAGTSSGRVFRLKEQGILQNGQKGDHYVTAMIHVPTTLTAEQRKHYEALRNLDT